jgi:dihydrofolate reductase
MSKLIVFNQVSVDGYFVDAKGDMGWAHKQDPEWNGFAADNAKGGGVLLFGRRTYEMMAHFWPTPAARAANAVVADQMNALPKVVFSRTLTEASWNNTRLIKGDLVAEVRKLKAETAVGLALMGSGTIVAQLTAAGLIDEYQVVVNPIILGRGRTMFEGVEQVRPLELTNTRRFSNGNVVLWYRPAA